MVPDLQPMKAFAVAIQGLPRTMGCPPDVDLGCRINRLTRYSQDTMDNVSLSSTPSGFILDLSANSSIVGVGRILGMLSSLMVWKVMTFMVSPKSMRVFRIYVPLIHTVTMGFPGSSYLSTQIWFVNWSTYWPMNWMVGGSFFFLPAFFRHSSLTILASIGMSRIAYSKGIFTHIFFNSVSILYSGGTTSFSKSNLSG